VQVYLSFASYI